MVGWKYDLLTTGLILAGALLLAAVVIALASRWRRRSEKTLTPGDQLSHFRSLYERGEISAEEFQRLRGILGGKVVQAVGGQPPARPANPPGDDKPPAPAEEPPPPPDGIRPA
jgi:hypothetical protein